MVSVFTSSAIDREFEPQSINQKIKKSKIIVIISFNLFSPLSAEELFIWR